MGSNIEEGKGVTQANQTFFRIPHIHKGHEGVQSDFINGGIMWNDTSCFYDALISLTCGINGLNVSENIPAILKVFHRADDAVVDSTVFHDREVGYYKKHLTDLYKGEGAVMAAFFNKDFVGEDIVEMVMSNLNTYLNKEKVGIQLELYDLNEIIGAEIKEMKLLSYLPVGRSRLERRLEKNVGEKMLLFAGEQAMSKSGILVFLKRPDGAHVFASSGYITDEDGSRELVIADSTAKDIDFWPEDLVGKFFLGTHSKIRRNPYPSGDQVDYSLPLLLVKPDVIES